MTFWKSVKGSKSFFLKFIFKIKAWLSKFPIHFFITVLKLYCIYEMVTLIFNASLISTHFFAPNVFSTYSCMFISRSPYILNYYWIDRLIKTIRWITVAIISIYLRLIRKILEKDSHSFKNCKISISYPAASDVAHMKEEGQLIVISSSSSSLKEDLSRYWK